MTLWLFDCNGCDFVGQAEGEMEVHFSANSACREAGYEKRVADLIEVEDVRRLMDEMAGQIASNATNLVTQQVNPTVSDTVETMERAVGAIQDGDTDAAIGLLVDELEWLLEEQDSWKRKAEDVADDPRENVRRRLGEAAGHDEECNICEAAEQVADGRFACRDCGEEYRVRKGETHNGRCPDCDTTKTDEVQNSQGDSGG